MIQWIRTNGNSRQVFLSILIGILAFLAVHIFNKVDAMPETYVTKTELHHTKVDIIDRLAEIAGDVKDINRYLRGH